jgi:hypothetical protein
MEARARRVNAHLAVDQMLQPELEPVSQRAQKLGLAESALDDTLGFERGKGGQPCQQADRLCARPVSIVKLPNGVGLVAALARKVVQEPPQPKKILTHLRNARVVYGHGRKPAHEGGEVEWVRVSLGPIDVLIPGVSGPNTRASMESGNSIEVLTKEGNGSLEVGPQPQGFGTMLERVIHVDVEEYVVLEALVVEEPMGESLNRT